jgi:hypothetical protein
MHWRTDWLRTPQDVEDAGEEIRTVMGRNAPSNDELCRTIRTMAGPEWRQDKAPTLKQLITAVYTLRKRENQNLADDPAERCDLCDNSGWLYVRFPSTINSETGVPCGCVAGRRVIEKCYRPYQQEAVRARSEAAVTIARRDQDNAGRTFDAPKETP